MSDTSLNDPDAREYVRRMARAEELQALAARASSPASRVLYLQLASAFQHLAEASAKRADGNDPGGG